jgi:murein DD-endopeptidase MepM/ murein hydrolase activator NlpD
MMTNLSHTANAGIAVKFRNLFKPRDIFFHDGKSLRRFSVGSRIQVGAVVLAVVLLAWSAFATLRIATAANSIDGEVAQMERHVAEMEQSLAAMRVRAAQHAAVLEQRQVFLTALLDGEQDPERLAALLPPTAAPAGAADAYSEVEGMQENFVARAHDTARDRLVATAQEIRRLGLNPARFLGRGGPLENVDAPEGADPRFRQLFVAWRQLDQLESGIIAIPSGRPVQLANFTSGFGTRSDPFRGSRAMHGGIDLAGPLGTPIYATADGIVGRSEYNNGGYGNLVEINHGQGIQTRYGHLSRLIARPGQRVRRGELIGLMGSTGRSTGSHLHYEVRIDGRAVNPTPFIQGNDTVAAVQRRAASSLPAVAVGGPQGGPPTAAR